MEWRSLKEYPLYIVSEYGDVKNIKTGKKLKTQLTYKGYPRLQLFRNGHGKKIYVHRLVAMLFIPDFHEDLEVNHLDGNKQNNHFSNLAMCTSFQNNLHAKRLGLMNYEGYKLTALEVQDIRKSEIEFVKSLVELYQVSHTTIRQIINHATWKEI